MAACVGCAEYVTAITMDPPPNPVPTLCAGPSTDLYNALSACTCTGACAATCAPGGTCDTKAMGCSDCVQNMGCMSEFGSCAGDI